AAGGPVRKPAVPAGQAEVDGVDHPHPAVGTDVERRGRLADPVRLTQEAGLSGPVPGRRPGNDLPDGPEVAKRVRPQIHRRQGVSDPAPVCAGGRDPEDLARPRVVDHDVLLEDATGKKLRGYPPGQQPAATVLREPQLREGAVPTPADERVPDRVADEVGGL